VVFNPHGAPRRIQFSTGIVVFPHEGIAATIRKLAGGLAQQEAVLEIGKVHP